MTRERFPTWALRRHRRCAVEADPANLAVYDVRQAEVAYLAGAAAALLSKSGAVSFIDGMEIHGDRQFRGQYENGADP